MSDLLTHVLAAYVVCTALSWHLPTIQPRHVPVAVVGAVVPDVAKVYLLLGSTTTAVAGMTFSWYALQTVGAVAAFVGAGALLFPAGERRRAVGLLSLGAALHVLLDIMVIRADGLSPPYLYPLTWWRPPSGDLYLSSDLWPSVLAFGVGLVVLVVDRRRRRDV